MQQASALPTPITETYTAHFTADAAIQSNEVYLTPCITVPSISFVSASDKRYSLGPQSTMRVKYRCPVVAFVRLPFSFPVKANLFTFEFETDPDGKLTHVSAVAFVSDRSMWPTIKKSETPGIAAHINLTSPFHPIARKDLRTAEGILSLIGVQSIDFDHAEESWLADTPEEKEELQLYGVTRGKIETPVNQWPFTSFDLVARAFLSAHKGRDIETALSFFRKGRLDVLEARYIEATFDFLFMIESLYAAGKFKSAQAEEQFLNTEELQTLIGKTVGDSTLRQNVAGDSRISASFARDYVGKSAVEITRHLVKLRGFLHHHTASRPDIWHPDDHVRYGGDAYFLQHLCMNVGFQISEPVWFAQEHVVEYQEQVVQAAKSGLIPGAERGGA